MLAVVSAAGLAGARERGADGHFDLRESSHFKLYQDVDIDQSGGLRGSRQFEQAVLADLERAYDRLDSFLGLRPPRKIEVVIYDPEIFDRQFAGLFRFAAAGFYHGVIRVRGSTRIDVRLTRILHHELVHAALDAAAPSFTYPAWFNEGLAEWFEARALGKRGVTTREHQALSGADRAGALIPMATLSAASFARLGPNAAGVAYLQSYGMIDYLTRHYGERKLRQFCQDLVRNRNLARSLKRTYRLDLATLDSRFRAELAS